MLCRFVAMPEITSRVCCVGVRNLWVGARALIYAPWNLGMRYQIPCGENRRAPGHVQSLLQKITSSRTVKYGVLEFRRIGVWAPPASCLDFLSGLRNRAKIFAAAQQKKIASRNAPTEVGRTTTCTHSGGVQKYRGRCSSKLAPVKHAQVDWILLVGAGRNRFLKKKRI